MHYRGFRTGAPAASLTNGKGVPRRNATAAHPLRAATRAVVESLERRQLLTAGDPIINEFLADNASGLRDVDLDRNDWIEIHNPGAQSVNLQGWKLQDSADIWTFPSVSIPANGYLVVFASDKDRTIVGQELHTNFRLSKEGEYLALIKPDGTRTSEFNPYPEQVEDVSYGLGGGDVSTQVLVGTGQEARTLVPPTGPDTLGRTWTGADESFNDSSWLVGPTGIGYENLPGSANNFTPLIATSIQSQMSGVNSSAYIRIPFELENLQNITKLTLRVKYDDGYIAYLNGQPVATKRLFGSTINNVSRANGDRNPESDVHLFEDVDLTPFIGALKEENNILAIQGLNALSTSSDFVIVPELIAETTDAGSGGALYMKTNTPGAVNVGGGLGVVKDTTFSVDRGFYDTAFPLTISTDTTGAEIRYTLDGSAPTATTGFVYTGPIVIGPQLFGLPGGPARPGVVTVRAAAFKAGWNPTNVDAQTYVFLDHVITQNATGLPDTWGYGPGINIKNPAGPDYAMDQNVVNANLGIRDDLKSLPTVNLSMPLNDWFGATTGIYPAGTGVPKAMSMEYFTADGAQQFQIDGSVEITGCCDGGTSAQRWKSYKLSMRLKFKEIYGDASLDFPLFGPDAATTFDTLVLDAQMNNTWLHPSSQQQSSAMLIQDQFIADLQNNMSGNDAAPHGKFVHLYLNGIYWGVYDLHERPDEHFGEEYYGGDDADYDVLKHTQSGVSNGTNAVYQQLLSAVRADVTQSANYAQVEQLLEIDDFIDYMLANYYGGNTDWAHKNWYATYNRVDPNGRWRFHSWDAEHVMTSGQGSGQIGPFVDVTGVNNPGGPTEIHHRLVLNPEYRQRFADRVNKHFFNGGALTPEKTAAAYEARMAEVHDAMVAESARWGDNRRSPGISYTRDNWLAFQNRLLSEFFPVRTANVLNQFRARGWYPATSAPTFSTHGGTFNDPVSVQITRTGAGQIYYTLDGSDPRLPGGALNASALLYTGAINISQSALLRARVLDAGNWSALTEAPFVIGPPPALRVTEIMYHPATPGPNSTTTATDYEFIELRNTGATAINLGGFKFTRGINFTFAPGTTLQPGARTVLVRNATAFAERYPGVTIGGVYAGSLDNAGERLILTTHLGQVIQNFEYEDNWYPQTDGEGFSLVAVNPNATNAELSKKDGWRPGDTFNGLPGAADPTTPVGSVVVNEVLANPTTVGGDFIELHNTTAAPISIGGWYLSDSADNLKKFRIAPGTSIPANGFIVFDESLFGVAGNQGVLVPFSLAPTGGAVYLTSADGTGNPMGYRDSVDFGASLPGVSFMRHVKSTGEADFWAASSPTPDAANSAPRVGPIVINEIMYGPAAGGDEFIELRNTSAATVNLFDPANPANTWKFTDGITFAFPQGASIAAGAYALVVGINPATFRTKYNIPQSVQIFGPYTGNLDNAGEKLELSMPGAPQGQSVPYIAVDRVHYASVAPWPTTPNTTGPSLSRRRASDYTNDVANWIASALNGGTPGASNGEDDSDPPTVDVVDVTPDPRKIGLNSITIVFNEPVTGFDIADLSLTRNGGANLLTSQSLASGDGRTWILNGLAGLTGAAGNYELTVKSTGTNIKDAGGNALVVGATDSWTLDNVAPTVDIVDVTPDPRGSAVNTITITFSEPVAGFDLADLSLTRSGSANLLTGSQTLTTTDNRTFTLGNLGSLTGVAGGYMLTLSATGAGIADLATNALANSATDTWAVDGSGPTVNIIDVSPDPRRDALNSITIVFSEPVTGFDLSDLTLTRNGNVVPGPGTLSSTDNVTWTLTGLGNLTSLEGNYELTLSASGSGIEDASGNVLVAGASDAWTMDFTGPTADVIDVTPDPRATPVNSVTIMFSEPVTAFDLADVTLRRDGGANLLSAAQTLVTTDNRTWVLGNLAGLTDASGSYTVSVITVNAIADAAGNAMTAGASDTFVVNTASPLVVTGTAGSDTFLVRREGANLKVYANADGTGTPVADRPFAGISSVSIDTLAGDDTIILDFTGVNFDTVRFVPAGGFTVNAGDGAGDVLRMVNPAGAVNVGASNNAHYFESINHAGVERHDVPATLPTLDITGPVHVKVNAQGALMTVDRLNIAAGAFLDLGDNDLKVVGGNLATIRALVASARNGAATRWRNPGIGTTAAGALTGLAVGMQGSDVLVKLTYDGDANADGRVNADDYFRIDSGFLGQPAAPRYDEGDFNYDGRINADDYFLIDSAFLGQTGVLAAPAPAAPAASAVASPVASASRTVTGEATASRKARKAPGSPNLFSDNRIARRQTRHTSRR